MAGGGGGAVDRSNDNLFLMAFGERDGEGGWWGEGARGRQRGQETQSSQGKVKAKSE